MASNSKQLALGAFVAGVIGIAAIFGIQFLAPPPTVEPVDVADVDEAVSDAEIELSADVEEALAPTVDNFRVEPDGIFSVSGRADAGQTIDVVIAGKTFETVQTDASGTFSILGMLEPSDEPRSLRLVLDPQGRAIKSVETYFIEPVTGISVAVADTNIGAESPVIGSVTAPSQEVAAVEENAETAIDVTEAAPEAPTVQASTGDVAVTEITDPTPTIQTPASPTILIADEAGVRVSTPKPADPTIPADIALDTITYDTEGEISLAGRAGSDFVQVYIDNKPVTSSRIADDGSWTTDLSEIETGVYTLRIDELTDDGVVVSRIETPFKREEPETVAAVMAEETSQDGFEVAFRTVQPGATLWAIATEELGEGLMYVAVYEANADLIRDPDLIYPGQVFRIPEANQ